MKSVALTLSSTLTKLPFCFTINFQAVALRPAIPSFSTSRRTYRSERRLRRTQAHYTKRGWGFDLSRYLLYFLLSSNFFFFFFKIWREIEGKQNLWIIDVGFQITLDLDFKSIDFKCLDILVIFLNLKVLKL